jgi:hypothetical protein
LSARPAAAGKGEMKLPQRDLEIESDDEHFGDLARREYTAGPR